MIDSRSILLVAVFCVVARLSGESTWAYVPASRDARSLGTLLVSAPPDEAAVRLIGVNPATRGPALEARRVFSIEIPNPREDQKTGDRTAESVASPIPEGARWPDTGGRIVAFSQEPSVLAREAGVRNPWEVRFRAKSASAETVFMCGGVVAGGIRGPVAILNGHIVKRGDAVGEFRVAGIFPNIVLLGRGGVVFVLPLGRSTTISTVTEG